MSRHQFYKGVSWLLLLNVAIKPLWLFVIDRVVQNRVGYEVYGTYFSMLGLCLSLSFLADVGLTNLMNREMANGTPLNIKTLFNLKLLFSLLYAVVIFLIAFIGKVKDWSLLVPLICIQVLTSYLLFFRAIITAQQLFKRDAWISVVDKGLMIFCCGLLLYTPMSGVFSLPIFLYIQVGALIVAILIATIVANKQVGNQISEQAIPVLKKAAPFMALVFLMSTHNRIDAFLLGGFHPDGAVESGVYASAYRLLDAGNLVGYLVASYLVPYATRHLNDAKLIDDVSVTLRQALLFAAVIVIAFVGVYSDWLQQLLYPSLAPPDPTILILCMATLPAYYLTHVYGSLLTAKGALKVFIPIVAFSLVINLTLNFFLISEGAIGCSLAAFISQGCCALGCMWACRKYMNVSLKLLPLLMIAAAGFLYWGFFYVSQALKISVATTMGIASVLTALLMFAWWQRIKKTLYYT